MKIPNEKELAPITKIRAQLASVFEQFDGMDEATRTAGEMAEAFTASIERQRTEVDEILRSGTHVGAQFQAPQPEHALGWLHALLGPKEFDKRVLAMCEPHCNGGVPAAEVGRKRVELNAKRRELEIAEERAVMALEDQGFNVARRRDIDAALVWRLWNE
jgi:hypothetical protein